MNALDFAPVFGFIVFFTGGASWIARPTLRKSWLIVGLIIALIAWSFVESDRCMSDWQRCTVDRGVK